ncbi:MAG: ATP-dependent Clp protease ATP-binding subunit [Cyanobacteria bacterium HKST-UBA02]|nr:ATP-dependent Clp protease ATP-binding subunit [Cyanobacteria bacterium HKST-UBA02]
MKTATERKTNVLDTGRHQTAHTVIRLDPGKLTEAEKSFSEGFAKSVIGQPEAEKVARMAYNAINNPLRDRTRPAGIYFLIGPSRTGKSLTAKTLARLFHGSQDALTRLQGGDYREDAQVLDLKGAPPMYTGYKDPTDQEKQPAPEDIDPTSVISTHNLKRARKGSQTEVDIIVIDEFEKSALEFYKLWMGVFDTAFLRLGNGQEVDFSNAIFILTSNLGMHELEKMARGPIGFSTGKKEIDRQDVASVVASAMARAYPPEFRNRLDAVVLFQPLQGAEKRRIVSREVELLQERIDKQLGAEAFGIEVTESAAATIMTRAEESGKGVAEIKRLLNLVLVEPLGRELQRGTINGGDLVSISVESGELSYCVIKGGRLVARSTETYNGTYITGSFDRRLERARQIADLMAAEGRAPQRYILRLSGAELKELEQLGTSLVADLESSFGLPVEMTALDRLEAPAFKAVFRATGELLDLIREKYPELSFKMVQ